MYSLCVSVCTCTIILYHVFFFLSDRLWWVSSTKSFCCQTRSGSWTWWEYVTPHLFMSLITFILCSQVSFFILNNFFLYCFSVHSLPPPSPSEKHTYNGLPELMTRVAKSELQNLDESVSECNVIYLPQVCMYCTYDITEIVVHVLILLSDVHVHTCTAAWKIIGTKTYTLANFDMKVNRKCSFVVIYATWWNILRCTLISLTWLHLPRADEWS